MPKLFTREPDSLELLNSINALYYFDGTESDFVAQITNNLAWLCRAPILLYISNSQIVGQFGVPENETIPESLWQTAANLFERAKENKFAQEPQLVPLFSLQQPLCLVSLLETGDENKEAFLLLIVDKRHYSQLNETIVRLRLLANLPALFYERNKKPLPFPLQNAGNVPAEFEQIMALSTDILALSALVINQTHFMSASILLVNEIAARFQCSRVYLGWDDGDYVKTIAISHLDSFERTTEIIQWIEAAFEEAFDQNVELIFPDNHDDSSVINAAHKNYLKKTYSSQLLSLPLRRDGNHVLAVLSCEKNEGDFSEKEIDALRLVLNQITPWLDELHFKNEWVGLRLKQTIQTTLNRCFSTENSLKKLGVLALSGVLFFVLFGKWDYRIEATAVVETDDLAYLTAPFDGYIDNVTVHAGDKVSRDTLLMQMNTQELILKESEAYSDVQRFLRESEKARGNEQNADMLIAQARTEQAQAKLEEMRFYLERATLKAPFDGVIIEGDKEDLLGVPISKGDTIFKLAKLTGMYLKVIVDEKNINAITENQTGEARLLSKPDIKLPIHVEKIIPLAQVDSAGLNSFNVKVLFENAPEEWIRPGMSGVVKVDAGKRNILWLLTHKTVDFLRLYFWW
ncbi:MAG: efflux RND transporter periplasmic adaptor subunit [Methylococcaceae bacterium]